MRIPENVSKDEWEEWCASHVTKAVVNELKSKRDFIASALGRGEILNLDNPMITHGNAARAWGKLESFNALIEFISPKDEPKIFEGGYEDEWTNE